MPRTDLLKTLVARELDTMDIFLTAKAIKTAITIEEYIRSRITQGADKDVLAQGLYKDLEDGGRIFGEFRNAIRATANGAVNRTRDNAIFSSVGIATSYRWVAVLINTCPDCLDRHNQVKDWDQWEAEGLPRTGHTVCKENCKCVLLPADNTETEPIQRKK